MTITIHYDFTDGTELSYYQGLTTNGDFNTCCLSFFSQEIFGNVIIVKKDGSYIDKNEVLSNKYDYTDKNIKRSHNIYKMFMTGAFKWRRV